MHIIAAKAQCFIEALQPEFTDYVKQVVLNSKAMVDVFIQHDFKVQTNDSDSHIILMDLSSSVYSGREAADLLENHGITVNKNGIPNDPRSFIETSAIRIGTSAETTRGHKEDWFKKLAEKMVEILK